MQDIHVLCIPTGLIGATTSSVTEEVSTKFSAKFKVPLVSYSSTATGLSDNTMHPYFMRTISPDGPLMEVGLFDWGNKNTLLYPFLPLEILF